MPVVRPCAICDGPGEGCFFGVFSCRCCAAFFRRSVREGRQYQCRGTGNCSINEAGMRNSCRACRLQRCIQNGMHPKWGGEKSAIGSTNSSVNQRRLQESMSEMDQGTSSDLLPSIQSAFSAPSFTADLTAAQVPPPFSATISGHFAKTAAKHKGLLQAICAQVFGPGILLYGLEQRLTHNDCIKLNKLSAPIYLEFVRTHFPELDSLQKEQKMEFMNNFCFRYAIILGFEITAIQIRKHPPANGILEKFYLFPNCIMDFSDNFEYFFSDVTGIGREEQRRTAQAITKEYCIHFVQNRYMPLAISPQEFAALTGILFWNTVKKTVEMPRINTQLEALYLELHQIIDQQQLQNANSPSPSSSVVRYGTLLTLLGDMTSMVDKEFIDMFIMFNLFLDPNSCPDYTETWEKLL